MKFGTFVYKGAKYGKTPLNLEFFESLSVSDILSSTKVFLLNLAETLGVTDLLSKFVGKTNTEAMGLSDSVSKMTMAQKIETLSVTDMFSRIAQRFVSLTESFTVRDSIKKVLNGLEEVWTIVAKDISDVWGRTSKDVSDVWTRTSKEASDLWTRISKPQ